MPNFDWEDELLYYFIAMLFVGIIVYWTYTTGQVKHKSFVDKCSVELSRELCEEIGRR